MKHETPATKYELFDTIVFKTEIGDYEFEVTDIGLKPIAGDYEKFLSTFNLNRIIRQQQIGELFVITNPKLRLLNDITKQIKSLTELRIEYNNAVARIIR